MEFKTKILSMLMICMFIVCGSACGSDDDEPDNQGSSGTTGKHEAVDLGLSVKWATTNVGAKTPSDYGDYFAWGETKPKSNYTDGNAKWWEVSYKELQSKGVTDANGNLTPEYDAATVNWGSNWRMPTEEEFQELLDKCTWTWTTVNGNKCYQITGPIGNSIYLPAAGFRDDGGLYYTGSYGFYWSSTAYEEYSYSLGFEYSSSQYLIDNFRYRGQSVRPVTE